jgi:cysteine peptidase B
LEGSQIHGINLFADLCAEEFKSYHNLIVPENRQPEFFPAPTAEEKGKVQDSFDWRTKGAVTPVKDQGQCGSCWAFSSTGNMEGQHEIASGTLLSLSEEELVQCSNNGNYGCNGGLMDNAFQWVIQNGGINSESAYPYTSGGGITGNCDNSGKSVSVAKYSSYKDVDHVEDTMKTWVTSNGPLAIAVDAASGWQTYSGGIVKNCNGRQLDHGVLIVGYGEDSTNTEYWIVKNSWSTSWGEQGYIRLEYGTDQCGITMMPSSIQV